VDNLTQIIALFREQNALIERLITMADGDFIISDTPLESLPSVTLPTSRPIRTNIAQNHAMAIAKRRMEKATVNHSNHQESRTPCSICCLKSEIPSGFLTSTE